MRSLPSVAVIVPNHRRVSELATALASVRDQTYGGLIRTYLVYQPRPDIEPLLASLDDRVRAIRFDADPSKAAIAAQRNVGIRASDEDLIAFLDDDDIWHPDKLTLQVAAMTSGSGDLATCTGWVRFTSPNEPAWPAAAPEPSHTLSRYQIVRSGLLMTSTLLVDGVIARRLLLNETPGWLGLDDYDFKLRIGEIGSMSLLPEALTAIRMDPTGTSRARQALQYARGLEVLCDWMRREKRRPTEWLGFAVRCAVTAVFPEGQRNDPDAIASLSRALDGRVLGRVDRWIARSVEAAWRSDRIVPAVRKLVMPRVTR